MMNQLELTGLDGANPLAFLAAIGTLRTLTLAWPDSDVRMSWHRTSAWRPVLHSDRAPLDEQAVIAAIHARLTAPGAARAFGLADNLDVTTGAFREFARQAAQAASPDDRSWADFMAAFACEGCHDKGIVHDTALRTMSGAGHQDFLLFMRRLVTETGPDHLRKALFAAWVYDDPGPSMRWDPSDDRRYALRWDDPSKDKVRTVRGANRLAVEGLPLFPTAPVAGRLETTGFRGRGSRDTFWTWPIWTVPIGLETLRSLLARPALQQDTPPRDVLMAMGAAEVHRSQRITIGKYRSLSPARAV